MAMSHKRELRCPFESPVESLTKKLCCLSVSSEQTDLENYCLAELSTTNECTDKMDTSSAPAEVQSDLFEVTMRHGSDGYQKISKTLVILEDDPWHEVFEKHLKLGIFVPIAVNTLIGMLSIRILQYTITMLLGSITAYVTLV